MARTRYPLSARILLSVISRSGSIRASYETLAARIGYDRNTVRVSIQRLEQNGQIRTHQGRGRIPNQYTVRTD
jgi:DNA-binding GntR family transcriptional regulator